MEATMKFNELEWRSDAVQASAGQVISYVARNSKLALLHYGFLSSLGSINNQTLDLVNYMHSPEAIANLEASTDFERERIREKMMDVSNKVRVMICQLRNADFGFWKRVYTKRLEELETANKALYSHAEAFGAIDSSVILLTKRDQERLLESLMAPDEPNDALRRAFMR
jgi:hypothetical protein